jgi:two-component system chemotaxis sensor kinase CheA
MLDCVRAARWNDLSADDGAGLLSRWTGAAGTATANMPGAPPQPDGTGAAQAVSACDAAAGGAGNDAGEFNTTVEIRFPSGFSEGPILACIIANRLQDLGTNVRSDPCVDDLKTDSPLPSITYRLQTDAQPGGIERVVRAYGVNDVRVIRCEMPASQPPAASVAMPQAPAAAAPTQAIAPAAASPATAAPVAAAASSGAAPAGTTRANGRSADSASAAGAGAEKGARTLRVDLERLDQLMNLGGELVITKARFVEVSRRLGAIFSQNNLHYLADDITERLSRLRSDISEMRSHPEPGRLVDALADAALHLNEDFVPVHGVMHRIHAARATMNEFAEAVHSLNRIADGLQKRIMQTRMVPIGPLFQRFRRVIRDLSQSTGKKVALVLRGEATELDKRMIDELVDPLTHMVRNSVDHGIEKPEDRVRAGKPEHGTVTLDAFHRGRHICIQVSDDGRGLDVARIRAKIVERGLANASQVEQMSDQEAMQYVFKPGFSTAPQITDLSGRGMGMDIVLNKIEELNGTVELTSVPGRGATFTIQLPLTLAIINAMLVRIGSEAYALPLETVVEIIQVPRSEVKYIHSQAVIRVREKVIPLVQLDQLLDLRDPAQWTASRDEPLVTVLILGQQNERLGLAVDRLIGQEDIVIKDIAANYRNVDGITGASIMGDGTVSLILDVGVLLQRASRGGARSEAGASRTRSDGKAAEPVGAAV